MRTAVDDDDTVPTGNTAVMDEIAAAIAAGPLGVVDWGAATSSGRRRSINEDAWGRRGDTFVVADGMGGRGGGALASRTAVDRLLASMPIRGDDQDRRRSIDHVNAEVVRAGEELGLNRLGTTLLAAIVGGPLVTLVHVGDSRAYRLTGDRARRRLDLLTHDHTVRSELLDAGLDVGEYRDRGVAVHGLTSYIGLDGDVLRVDVLSVPVRSGDRVLLCTDGVHRQLDDDRIGTAMAASRARSAAERLIHDADVAGGRDDATAIVVQIGPTSALGDAP